METNELYTIWVIHKDVDIKINNVSIGRAKRSKFLGIHVNSLLNQDVHLNIIKTQISKSVGVLNRVMYKIDEKTNLMLCSTSIV